MVYTPKVPTVAEALCKVQTKVYKQRIRIKEFLVDFDKLRCYYISKKQFLSALSMAGLALSAEEMEVLAEAYSNKNDPQLRVQYGNFIADVDSVFGKSNLEMNPQVYVPQDPGQLINSSRFVEMPIRDLGDEKELKLREILEKLSYDCRTKRISVKPFFDDSSKNQNSPVMVNHVSEQQFKQALKNHIAPEMAWDEVCLLIEKFRGDEQFDDMINYVAFARAIDPPPPKFDSYTLKNLGDC
eukprot:CAMPEP_0196570404 /NCGR_PEP_ID=MMETSP1081-20130531/473_1 /TAXON_ID=36882 /ORGANISM="Pyramimonas amylifera, Strain CCMP720" /LENGTH=240 /DNA_ID=CAMNT_0041886823 /DNA_START=119 /DNA_END=841 /DNA_ORIENTATION=+